ncbi:DUF262 domain-containing protein [Aquimarina muelleri]|uniref:GmrSD restriction endonucleases N-terminal domain-containing protein n=1 Tax=Aquimarina muelleri TaxID=279356 RepID=A0A918N3F4_9FLAO|nr:DUF262 domain-containing protein [Aquimarina muelleri]MCX2764600.1 DUF262 domain-containing protein [Aquimarina muelleri]GGX19328.1 hypothetical protein GCM10007384_20860 [Aquimarina muelleri]
MTDQEITKDDLQEWQAQDLESNTEEQGNSTDLEALRVIKSNQDYNLDYLITSIDKNIDLGPDYQRRSRWSKNKQSMLIESFLMNIPVPPIFLYEKEYYEYEVIDGRQRLEAINSFVKNEFKLKGLQHLKSLIGKKFSDLNDETKRSLFRRTISATILLVESKAFDKYDLRMILFNRLNTGGEKLNGQELRNAIYASRFNDLIMELSSNKHFKFIWDIPIPTDDDDTITIKKLKNNTLYKTMTDCELVLRFFAIREVQEGIITEGSMSSLLDKTMKSKQHIIDANELESLKKLFIDSVEGLVNRVGKEAIINPILNTPRKARNLYDSMLVAFSYIDLNNLQPKEVILENLRIVLSNEKEYEEIITRGNSIENIKYRVNKAKEILTTNLNI